jgi:hypothetical protein
MDEHSGERGTGYADLILFGPKPERTRKERSSGRLGGLRCRLPYLSRGRSSGYQSDSGFYVWSFGYQLESEIIHDPRLQAYVQFLRFHGDRVYLELVQPDDPSSQLNQVITEGGGLNHVRYATDNIEAACQAL